MAEDTAREVEQSSGPNSGANYGHLTDAVRELVQVMRLGELERLEITQGDLHILLCARSSNAVQSAAASPVPAQASAAPAHEPSSAEMDNGNFHHITSPMVGTFYEAPSPGEPPFVRPGDSVEAGQTVAIIEAMKIMNEIVADRAGLVDAVLVENGEAVEYGHPLFRIRPG